MNDVTHGALRVGAERAAGALPGSLERISEAEGRSERIYRTSIEGQRAADTTGVPRLSASAEAVIGVLRAAPDEEARGEVWRAVQKDEQLAVELGTFKVAVAQRFGDDGAPQMLRAAERPGAITSASVAPEKQPVLDQVAELTAMPKQGERASASLCQREAERERQGQRQGLRM